MNKMISLKKLIAKMQSEKTHYDFPPKMRLMNWLNDDCFVLTCNTRLDDSVLRNCASEFNFEYEGFLFDAKNILKFRYFFKK